MAQLVARSADTPVAVRGLLHVSPEAVRLCGAVMESHPVQCGQPWVELVGLDVSTIAGTTTAEGVTWRESVVLDVVRDVDGRYRVVGVGA
ncbi:MAG: hypothetical protein IPM45_07600 [Acidimicrobiales bacterium]|nr:hypothetical protein [Acidimicrobiales bacterium]